MRDQVTDTTLRLVFAKELDAVALLIRVRDAVVRPRCIDRFARKLTGLGVFPRVVFDVSLNTCIIECMEYFEICKLVA